MDTLVHMLKNGNKRFQLYVALYIEGHESEIGQSNKQISAVILMVSTHQELSI